MQKMFAGVAVIGAILSTLKGSAFGACTVADVSPVTVTTKAVHNSSKVFFRTSGLELDFDGNPHAYGVRDQGEENICVGLAPLRPPCHGKFQGACYKVCQEAFAAWSRHSGDPQRIADTMCAVGLGGGGCSRPDISLQKPPNQDWFVSETSLKLSPSSSAVDSKWLHGQDAQLDPAKVRYIVVPGALTRPPWNVKLGDVGIAFNAASATPVPFIVGDGGGLGEGSVSLLAALRPDKPPQLKTLRGALGEEVKRYTAGVEGDFHFVIFTGTAANVMGMKNVTAKTAAELGDWIDTTANGAFKKSSVQDVTSCSKLAPSIRK